MIQYAQYIYLYIHVSIYTYKYYTCTVWLYFTVYLVYKTQSISLQCLYSFLFDTLPLYVITKL